jgi:integrase
MPRTAILKPARRNARATKGLAAWAVNVPSELSPTGKRQELFFATKGEATAECEKLKARKDNFGSSLGSMSSARIEKAAEAYKLLDPIGIDLLVAVRNYLEGHKQRTASVPFADLFSSYIEAKADRDAAYLKELRVTRDRAEFHALRSRFVSDIKPRDLRPILDAMTPGARNPVMRYLRAIFNFGIKRGYLSENPIDRLDFADRPRHEVVTVPIDQVSAILQHALENDLELLPFLTLGFFCGIRPDGELLELEWSDVKLAENEVVIRPEVSKTNRRRFVDLSDNAKAWLAAYAERGGVMAGKVVRYTESELRRHRRANWQAAGIVDWPQQGMRHTYCSNWLAVHKDVNRLVLMSGHDSVDTMWRNYHAGIPEAEAKRFWEITPPTAERKIIHLARA